MLTALKLLATAGLGAVYLAVAVLAAHPHVDAEYDAHFVHRTAECWIPRALRPENAAQPASVELGRIGYPEACRYLRLGWFDLEDWGAWAYGDEATLRLPRRPGARAVELTLRAAPPPNPAIRVRLVLNDYAAEDEIAPGMTKTIIVPLPPEGEPYDPDMHLRFLDYATVPNPPLRPNRFPKGGMRKVGFGLVAIRYLPPQAEEFRGKL